MIACALIEFPQHAPESFLISLHEAGIQHCLQGPSCHIREDRCRSLPFLDAAVRDLQLSSCIPRLQSPAGLLHPAHMAVSSRRGRLFDDFPAAVCTDAQLGIDLKFLGPVIGKLAVFHRQRRSDHRCKGIGEKGKQAILGQAVIGLFLIKEQQSVPVEIPDIVRQLAGIRQSLFGIDAAGEFIIRIGIIKMRIRDAAGGKELLQGRL